MASDSQIHANRENAQHSTGPTSPEGKAKSSLNAVKTALTGRTVLLPSDDVEAYQQHLEDFAKKHAPATPEESALVQSLADTEWRLLRIPSLEMGIYAVGRIQLAAAFASEPDPQVRSALLDAQTYLTYHKQLSNLNLQSARLRRQRDKDLADLARLQKERREATKLAVSQCRQLFEIAEKEDWTFDPTEFGFEISMDLVHRDIKARQLHRAGYLPGIAELLARKAA